MRIAVADSMRRSWNRPLATIAMEVCMDPMMTHRRHRRSTERHHLRHVAALALALKANDGALRRRWFGERLVHPETIDIAFAMEIDDGANAGDHRRRRHRPRRN